MLMSHTTDAKIEIQRKQISEGVFAGSHLLENVNTANIRKFSTWKIPLSV